MTTDTQTVELQAFEVFSATRWWVEVEIDGTWHQTRGTGFADDAGPGVVVLQLWDGVSWDKMLCGDGEEAWYEDQERTFNSRNLSPEEILHVRASTPAIGRIRDYLRNNRSYVRRWISTPSTI